MVLRAESANRTLIRQRIRPTAGPPSRRPSVTVVLSHTHTAVTRPTSPPLHSHGSKSKHWTRRSPHNISHEPCGESGETATADADPRTASRPLSSVSPPKAQPTTHGAKHKPTHARTHTHTHKHKTTAACVRPSGAWPSARTSARPSQAGVARRERPAHALSPTASCPAQQLRQPRSRPRC